MADNDQTTPKKPRQFRFTLPDGSKTDWLSGTSEADAWAKYQKSKMPTTTESDSPAASQDAPDLGWPLTPGSEIPVLDWPSDFARGATRGLAGDVVGAGQIGGDVLRHLGAGDAADAIGASRGARALTSYANAPSYNTAESLGRFVGAGLPFGGMRNPVAMGALTGAVQPTESGDLLSHSINTALGAGTSWGLSRLLSHGAAEPANVSAEWWNRALNLIGVPQRLRPNQLKPETNAQIQTIIGDRLNNLRSQMTFDAGAALQPFVNAINQVTGRLDPAYQRNWQELAQVYILDPISSGASLTGANLADYVSRLGGEAETLFRRSLSKMPDASQYRTQADALRAIVNHIERVGTQGNRALWDGINAAKQAYFQWSIGDAVMSAARDSTASAKQLLGEWQTRLGGKQGGAARLGRVTGQEAELRDWLTQANKNQPKSRATIWQGLRIIPAAAAWWLTSDFGLPWEARWGAAATAATTLDPTRIASFLARSPGFVRAAPAITGVAAGQVPQDQQSYDDLLQTLAGPFAGPMQ